MDLEPVEFDLRDSLEEVMRTLSIRAHAKGLELILDVHQDVPDCVRADPVRLRQIIINLVGNAIKFTDKGEIATVVEAGRREGGRLRLDFAVRDTGIGIPMEKQKAIFEAFAQADGSVTRRFGGTGLGLTISNRLVQMMGGEIGVQSEPGAGSCFHFTAWCEEGTPAQKTPPADDSFLIGKHVLIVDDHPVNRRILMEQLAKWKMRPETACSGFEALAKLRDCAGQGDPIVLVVSDFHMPEMDGLELAARIQQTFPRLPVILLTSGEAPGGLEHFRSAGVVDYLTKPARRSELRKLVIAGLNGRPPGTQAANSASAQTRVTAEPQRPLRILLAEDNVVNQRVARKILERHGHTVAVASHGREALEATENESFDLILMDVQMPEMDGLQATEAIRLRERQTHTHIPIIAMTAHAMKGDQELCLAAGMDAYLSKPIRVLELIEILRRFARPLETAGCPISADGSRSIPQ